MAHFLVIHKLAESADGRDFQEMRAARREIVKMTANPEIQWLGGWWVFDSAQQLCLYQASDKETITRALRESGMEELLPAIRIDEVMLSGPNDFPGEFSE